MLDFNLNKQEMHCLQHMLGVGPHIKKSEWGYRNHFAVDLESDDYKTMKKLEQLGLVRGSHQNKTIYGDMVFFYATEQGCKTAGLNKTQTKRAFEK